VALGLDLIQIRMSLRGARQAAAEARATSGAISGIGGAQRAANRHLTEGARRNERLRQSYRALSRAAMFATGFLGVGLALGIKDSVSETIDLAKTTRGLTRYTDLSTKSASRWAEVTKVRDVDARSLNMSMISLGRNIRNARDGSETSVKAFQDLGISQKFVKENDTSAVLLKMSDAFAAMPGGATKAAVSQALLGRGAQKLLPILDSGSAALKDQLALSDKYGTTMGKKRVDDVLALLQAQRELEMSWDGMQIQMSRFLVPALTSVSKGMSSFFDALRDGKTWAWAIVAAIVGLTAAFVALGISAAVAWAIALGPIALIVAGIAAVIAVFFLLYTRVEAFRNAVNFAWNFIKGHWPLLVAIFAPFLIPLLLAIKYFGRIKAVASSVFNWLKGAVGTVRSALSSGWGAVAGAVSGAFRSVVNSAIDALNWLIGAFNSVFDRTIDPPGPGPKFEGIHIDEIGHIGGGGSYKYTGKEQLSRGGLALGGTTMRLGDYWVGEKGPELLRLPRASTVVPKIPAMPTAQSDVRSLDGSEFGGGRKIVVPVYLKGKKIAEAVADEAEFRVARQ